MRWEDLLNKSIWVRGRSREMGSSYYCIRKLKHKQKTRGCTDNPGGVTVDIKPEGSKVFKSTEKSLVSQSTEGKEQTRRLGDSTINLEGQNVGD